LSLGPKIYFYRWHLHLLAGFFTGINGVTLFAKSIGFGSSLGGVGVGVGVGVRVGTGVIFCRFSDEDGRSINIHLD
jgi:hypothetical protein